MSLLAMAYPLLDRPMQRRFLACPAFKAADLLLQERVPQTAAKVLSEDYELAKSREALPVTAKASCASLPIPICPRREVHLLSNGRYHVVVSSAGGGYSRWRDLAVTRWREDATRDSWGTFIYLRDLATGEFWSAAHQPCLRTTKGYEAIFTQARAEFRQRHAGLEVHTEISVSPEDDVELRRITLTNHSNAARVIELTSYAEVVLAPPAGGRFPPRLQQSVRPNRICPAPRPPCFAPAAPAPKVNNRPGWSISWSAGRRARARSPVKPTARQLSSGAVARWPSPPPWTRCAALQHHRLRPGSH